MAREGGGRPYTPALVPQIHLDLAVEGLVPREVTAIEVQRQLIDLERFLETELQAISESVITATVQAAYGALTVAPGPAPDQPLVDGVPEAVTGFNSFAPQVPNRVTATFTPADSLVPEEGGIYQVMAVLSVVISSGVEYTLTMAVNGTLTGIFNTVDASNQTSSINLILYGMISLNPGDVVTLIVVANGPGGPHTFIIESGIFSLTRISERNDEPGIF